MAGTLGLPATEVLLRLGVAAVLGGLVGLERERLERAAGLRTHALVAVASALMMIVSAYGFADAVTPEQAGALDPSRLAAQVVSGIGFLGAGVIIFQKNRVRGLTTAASIWSVAGLGLAAGGGLFLAAGLGAGFILIIQAVLRPVERRLFVHHQDHRLALRVTQGANRLAAVERAVAAAAVELRRMRLREERAGTEDRVDLDLGTPSPGAVTALVDALRAIEGVRVVSYSLEPRTMGRSGGGDDLDGLNGTEDGSESRSSVDRRRLQHHRHAPVTSGRERSSLSLRRRIGTSTPDPR